MDIYSYVDKYGKYTFQEEEFNEVDAVLFSFLSYATFEEILKPKDKFTINKIANMHIEKYTGKDRNIIAVKEANKMIRYLKNTKRYKDCLIYNHEYIGNDKVQFGAISIEYLPHKVYVSFEGTDQMFSGWIEDFILSYKFPTISHELAIQYLNKHFTFNFKELILGGHSKGGNLALVGGLMSNIFVKSKIKKIYNVDGPGLLDKEFNSKKYNKLKDKYLHIIPDSSFVGLFLNHSNDYIVESNTKPIISHAITTWKIEDKSFKKTKLTPFSKKFDEDLIKWFKKYNKEEKEAFIHNLEDVLKKANIDSILDLKTNASNVFNLIYESKDINKQTKNVSIDFLNLLISCFTNTKKEEFKEFVSNIFNIKN